MRIVLVDLEGKSGLVTKDTVAGGYGSRFVPFSRTTRWYCRVKRTYSLLPSIQLGYLAAIAARRGHEVIFTRDAIPDGDVAIVLSSLVDYRRELDWADMARSCGLRVGFVGLACSSLPELYRDHADFIVVGEPEAAMERLCSSSSLSGTCVSPAISDLNALPLPRWDLLEHWTDLFLHVSMTGLRPKRRFPLLASRSCPEFCTYCPHRILAEYRARSVSSVIEELQALCDRYRHPFVIFRDPLFTKSSERCLELCDAILAGGLDLEFECETRLDHLDPVLLRKLRRAGLRAVTFGVESISSKTLRKVGRRPTSTAQQRVVLDECARLGIRTAAFYVFGFLEDEWDSLAATIEYAIALGSTVAQFKILTPYPKTPLWKQLAPLVYERDWEKFDGYTPTFRHPNLKPEELRFLLGVAYARFYARPSFVKNLFRIEASGLTRLVERLDETTRRVHSRQEMTDTPRPVTC